MEEVFGSNYLFWLIPVKPNLNINFMDEQFSSYDRNLDTYELSSIF